mmetsp:Transcript_29836/g.47655  ORF Transcript_29836/g.47655 Transcript_29836/m.47655 type:complete len:672 (+) Transcript_29836:74-2089(+)
MVPIGVRNCRWLQLVGCISCQLLIHASNQPSDDTCVQNARPEVSGVALLATKSRRAKVDVVEVNLPMQDPQKAPPLEVIPDFLQTEKMKELVPAIAESNASKEAAGTDVNSESAGHPYPISENVPDRDEDYVRDDDGPWLYKSYRGKKNNSESEAMEDIVDEDEEPAEKKHVYARYVVAPLSFVFFAVFTLSTVMEKLNITEIPESAILIFFGGLLSVFSSMYGMQLSDEVFQHVMPKTLNLVFLPILIFGCGWTIRRQDFFSQFPYILLFAFVGVALSTLVIGFLIYMTGSYGLHSVTTIRTAFAYATLISATDPVATMSTYAKLKVEPLLNIMVFGESIINDAVAVVFFNVLNSDHFMLNSKGQTMTGLQLGGSIAWGIGKIFFGSVIVGVGLGMIYTVIARCAEMHENKKGQILVILASCYLTYALAESINMSGIIATMFSGVLMGVYMRPHLSTEGSLLATFFVKQLSTLADAGVFLLVGFAVMQLTTNGWYFGLWVMLFSLIGRAASVYPVGFAVNALKMGLGKANGVPPEGWNMLSSAHMFMMWHAGLRGGIALALSLELGKWVDVIDGPGTRRTLQTATFMLIVAFLLVFGGSTSYFLKKLGIRLGVDDPPDALSKTESMGRLRGFIRAIDKKILSPLLLGDQNKPVDEDEADAEDYLKGVRAY